MEFHLLVSSLPGPAISESFLKGRRLKLSFDPLVDVGDESHDSGIWALLCSAELVLTNETLEDLIGIKTSVDKTLKKIHEIEVMCKMKECFTGYFDYLESWDAEEAKSNHQSTLES